MGNKLRLFSALVIEVIICLSFLAACSSPSYDPPSITTIPNETVPRVTTSCDPLSSFEKNSWRMFSNGNDVTSLLVNGDSVWAATTGGVVRWNVKESSYRKYTTLDGLGDNEARIIIADESDNIWVATGFGVSRFDGERWKTFTNSNELGGDYVHSMIIDSDGNLWLATDGDLTRFDGVTWSSFAEIYSRDIGSCNLIFQDSQGGYWIGQTDSVIHYDGRSWANYDRNSGLLCDSVTSVFEDNSGNIWVQTMNPATHTTPIGGWSKFDGTQWQNYTYDDGLVSGYADFVGEDSDGNLWFSSQSGAGRFNGKEWYTYTSEDGLVGDWINGMAEDSLGYVWLSSGYSDGGVSVYDGENWTTYSKDDGLLSVNTQCITTDEKGRIWVGTEYGISLFDNGQWLNYIIDEELPGNCIESIVQDANGNIWVWEQSYTNRLHQYDGAHWVSYDSSASINRVYPDKNGNLWAFMRSNHVFVFDGLTWQTMPAEHESRACLSKYVDQDSSGNIWLVGDKCISRFDGEEWKTIEYTQGLSLRSVNTVIEDTLSGDIWIATSFGVFRKSGEDWSSYTTRSGLPDNLVMDIAQDKNGIIWAITSEGTAYFNGSSWVKGPYPIHGNIFVTMFSGSKSIIKDNNGNLWFITLRNGVVRFDGTNWKRFNMEDSLIHDSISYGFADSRGNLWFVAENKGSIAGFNVTPHYGICRFDGENWEVYDTSSGLPNNIVDCIFEDQSGNIWFGTSNGIARWAPN